MSRDPASPDPQPDAQLDDDDFPIEIKTFDSGMPESYILAYKGYLAGAFEWGDLDFPEYQELDRLLPTLNMPNPTGDLFLFD